MACGRRGPQSSFERLHVALGEESARVVFDEPGEARCGRGAYICPALVCLDRALKKRALGRALRCTPLVDESALRVELLKRLDARWKRESGGR
ncbi:MAG: YlxR family protein [Gaiellales bacterium]|nr:YlxR family protein [Gaiellales bacterium]